MATPNYEIDYNDERFQNVQTEKQNQLTQVNNTYDQMINSSDKYFQDQIDAVNQYKDQQTQIQQDNTAFAIDKINQNKEQAEKNYIKEQKASYVDWQKQSNQYGVNAESMAMQGLAGTGFSESSQVSMYNTYQNRVTAARETFSQAVLNYDNSIKEAQLANNSALAEIAYNALQQSLELTLQGFEYKNTLVLDQLNKQQEIDNTYYGRWQDVQNQINQENQFAESIRQYEQEYTQKIKEYQESIRQFDTQLAYYKEKDKQAYELEIKKLEEQKRQAQQEQANWEKEYALAKQSASRSSSGSSSRSSGSSSSKTKLTNTSKNSVPAPTPVNLFSSSKKSAQYNNILNMARTTYNASKFSYNKTGMTEDVLARAISKGQITESEAAQILKTIGIK